MSSNTCLLIASQFILSQTVNAKFLVTLILYRDLNRKSVDSDLDLDTVDLDSSAVDLDSDPKDSDSEPEDSDSVYSTTSLKICENSAGTV